MFSKNLRITSLVTLFFFVFQIPIVAYAQGLSAAQVTAHVAGNPSYEYSDNSRYQYQAASYIQPPAISRGIEHFGKTLQQQSKTTLGQALLVPISNGDITFFIETFPAANQPLIGTDFVQSRFIRAQVQELLGRTLIDQNRDGSENQQLVSLYQNALSYAQKHSNARFGQPLGLSQQDNGTAYDFLWPESRLVNGVNVLVPVLYLAGATYEAQRVDAQVTEFNGDITNFGSISITNATVKLGRDSFISVLNDLTLDNGHIAAAGDLEIVAGGNVSLLASQLDAQGNLTIEAESFMAATPVVHHFGSSDANFNSLGEITSITAGGDITITSRGNIELYGVHVSAGEAITFDADGRIYIGSTEVTNSYDNGKSNGSTIHYLQSKLTADETIRLIAGTDIVIDAAEIVSNRGHIELLAQYGITIEDDMQATSYYKKTDDEEISSYKTVAIRALLDAGKGVRLHTEYGDIRLKAADLRSTEGTRASAQNGAVNLLMSIENDQYSYSGTDEGMWTTTTKNYGHNKETGVYNTVVGGFSVEALNGITVQYEDDDTLSLSQQVDKLSQQPDMAWMATLMEQHPDADWQAMELEYETWKEENTTLSGAAMAIIIVVVTVVTAGAGTGPAAAGGAAAGSAASAAGASAAVTATVASATNVAISAGLSAMATQSAVATANGLLNGDSFSDIMKEIHSDENLKNVATAMITAGVIDAIGTTFFTPSTEEIEAAREAAEAQAAKDGLDIFKDAKEIAARVEKAVEALHELSFAQQATQLVVNSAVRTSISTMVNGGNLDDFTDAFGYALGSSLVSYVGEDIAGHIGGSEMDKLSKYLAHFALGCGLGVLQHGVEGHGSDRASESCASGAAGAVVGELAGEFYNEITHTDFSELNRWHAQGAGFAEVLSIMTIHMAGGDYQIAGMTGRNAAENNALSIVEKFRLIKQTAMCLSGPQPAACLTNTATNAYSKYLANDAAVREGFMIGLDDAATGYKELPANVYALASLIMQGEMDQVLNLMQESIASMPQALADEVTELVDSSFKYIVTAENEGDYQQVGKSMSKVAVAAAEYALTAGGATLLKSLKTIAKGPNGDRDYTQHDNRDDLYKDYNERVAFDRHKQELLEQTVQWKDYDEFAGSRSKFDLNYWEGGRKTDAVEVNMAQANIRWEDGGLDPDHGLVSKSAISWKLGTVVEDVILKKGTRVWTVERFDANKPGYWSTTQTFSSMAEARDALALLPMFSKPIGERYVMREYKVINENGVRARSGTAGALSENGIHYGGNSPQYEYVEDFRDKPGSTAPPKWQGFFKKTGNVINLGTETL